MSDVAARINAGDLPRTLDGADWRLYFRWHMTTVDWCNWCRMWLAIAWVRYQAFVRDADVEAESEDLESWAAR